METLEKSRVCRLCGKQSGISIDIFDKNENHVRKINAVLPILVHEMDLLPKQMCHRCSYKLEEFYNFYVECAKTDNELKSQLSWMRKENSEEQIKTPMVKMTPFKIKTEPPDNDSDFNDYFGYSSYDSYASPILTCSRCRCLCSTTVKVSNSPKEVKSAKDDLENQPHSSNIISNSLNEKLELKKSEKLDNNIEKDSYEDDSVKEISVKEQEKEVIVVNVDNDCNTSKEVYEVDAQNSEILNRALRPRKGSVDYIIRSRKKPVPKLKEKCENKLNTFNSVLVDPVNVKLTTSNSLNSCPIIKLEKVDEAIQFIRKRKNLEEFNKRIKHLKQSRKLEREDTSHNKFLRRLENRSKMTFKREAKFESLNTGTNLKKSLHEGEYLNNDSTLIVKESKNTTGKNRNERCLTVEVNQVKKCLKEKKEQCVKKENQNRKSLHKEEKFCKDSLNENKKARHFSMYNIKSNTVENVTKITEQKIEKKINNVSESNGIVEEQLPKQKISLKTNFPNENSLSKRTKSLDRHPMCPIVKLEKDYTCNVDYPRVKIKRQLSIGEHSKSADNTLEVSTEPKDVFENVTEKKLSKSDICLSKNLRRKEKRLSTISNTDEPRRILKKKCKQLDLVSVKKVMSEKELPLPQNEFKYFCDECDMCFRNKELFKLHPCYQK